MINAASESYPVRGAANDTGVDYSLALAWVDAPDRAAAGQARTRIIAAHGLPAFDQLHRLVEIAYGRRLVRVRRWPGVNGWWRR